MGESRVLSPAEATQRATVSAPRVALIADLHGNLAALDAVLGALEGQSVERIVCLGDLALSGPQPRETIERVRRLGCPVVLGNCDDLIVRMRAHGPLSATETGHAGLAPWVAAIDHWSAAQLSPDELAYLTALPFAVTIPLGAAGTMLCVHGSPHSFIDRLLPDTADEALATLVPHGMRVLACGHTHVPMVRQYLEVTIVNPGSVGLPLSRDVATGGVTNPAWAEYALVTREGTNVRAELHRVPLDEAALRAVARASGMPHVEKWRDDWHTR